MKRRFFVRRTCTSARRTGTWRLPPDTRRGKEPAPCRGRRPSIPGALLPQVVAEFHPGHIAHLHVGGPGHLHTVVPEHERDFRRLFEPALSAASAAGHLRPRPADDSGGAQLLANDRRVDDRGAVLAAE